MRVSVSNVMWWKSADSWPVRLTSVAFALTLSCILGCPRAGLLKASNSVMLMSCRSSPLVWFKRMSNLSPATHSCDSMVQILAVIAVVAIISPPCCPYATFPVQGRSKVSTLSKTPFVNSFVMPVTLLRCCSGDGVDSTLNVVQLKHTPNASGELLNIAPPVRFAMLLTNRLWDRPRKWESASWASLSLFSIKKYNTPESACKSKRIRTYHWNVHKRSSYCWNLH